MSGTTLRRSLLLALLSGFAALLVAAPVAAQLPEVLYQDDFQSHGTQKNPPGWVDTSVGGSAAPGLYKTWIDPTQHPAHGTNIVYGTKQASGKPGQTPRIGTFSTLTTRHFSASGRFEYRGRLIRTRSDSHIGLTFLSAYPEQDRYYLIGTWGSPLRMQLLSFGTGTFTGNTDSGFTPATNEWYRFLIRVDDAGGETTIRARFWLDGTDEPDAFSIDAVDASSQRLTSGRIGIWAAVRGEVYVDDLWAKSPVDHSPPVIELLESGAPLAEGAQFNRDAVPEIHVTDDITGVASVTATLDGAPYTSLTPVTGDGTHTLHVRAADHAGNESEASRSFSIDKTPPVVRLLESGSDFPDGFHFNRDVVPDVSITDISPTTTTATLNGAPYTRGTPISAEGTYALTVTVTDALAWATTVGPVSFTIDKTPPAVTFTSHAEGDVLAVRDIIAGGASGDAITVVVNGQAAAIDATAGTWSLPLALLEGENAVTVVARDRATNQTTITRRLHLDTRAPELTVDATPACTNADSLELRGTIADPNIDKVEVRLGDSTIPATVTGNAWTATLPLGDEGSKAILVEASDSIGHVSTRSVTVGVDRTAPAIEISESGTPFTATIAGRAVTLFMRANDADSSSTVTTTLDGTAYTSGAQVAAEGEHTIRVVARDCAGNESTREHTFAIDLTAPRFLTFIPASGSKVTQIPSALGGTTDTDAVEVRILGTGVTAPVSNGAFTIANAGFAEGVNDLSLEVTDRAGHTGRASYTLGIRTAKPLVEITESGDAIADGAVYRRAIEPRVRVFDPEVTFTATLNGAPFASGSSVSADGAYTIAATATDTAYGQTNSVTRTFTIDRTGPAVDILSPADGTIVDSDRVDVRVNAADAASVSVNATAATKPADGSWLAPAVPLDLGGNTLVATGRDAAGNAGSDSIEVTRGGTGPALVLAFPPDLYVTNRPLLDVTGRVLRPGSSVSVSVPPASAVTAAVDAAGGFRLSGAQLTEGEWTILATATEGGKTVEASARVIADFTPPRVQILESGQPLTDGAGFATQAVLSGEASDKGQAVDSVLVVDGNAVASPVTIDATGGHSVVLTARDAAGNESRLERTFFIGSAGAGGCRLEAFDPPDFSVINSQRVELVGRSGGAAGVKVNGVAANMSAGSFCANVELPQEGSNSVTIQCTDAAGEPVGDPVVITLIRATDEPSVSILTPVEDFVTPDELLVVTGTLGLAVDNAAVSVAVNGKPATITGTTWTATDVRLQDGINVLVARAKNIAGKTAVASRRGTYFAKAPSITITAPVPGFITGSPTVDVTGTWINVDPTSLVVEGLAGAVSAEAWSDTTGRFSAAAQPLQAGDNTIRISGSDRTGRIAHAEVAVRYETTLPAITITTPVDNHVFAAGQGTAFRVSGSFAAAAGSSIVVNGVPATIDAEAKTFFADVEFASTPGGITPVIAQLSQPSGGSGAFASIRVLRLGDAPRILETFPIPNAVEVDSGAVVLVLFSAPMERASTAAAFTLENVNGTPVSGKTYLDKDVLTFAPAATLMPGERYTIRVATGAKDLAGQPLAEAVANDFVVATTAPTTAPAITTPSGRICAQLADVAGTTTPGVRVRIDYGQVFFTTTASATGAFSYKVPLSGQQGFHVIRVRTIGADGTLSPAAELKLDVDCSGPRVLSASYDRTVNQLTIVFSREVRPESLTTGAAGTIQLVLTDGTVFDGAVSVTGANAIVTPSPSLAETSFTLRVTTGVEDTPGRKLELPHTQHFPLSDGEPEAGDGRGTIAGEVYDATTGRPLAGAEIAIEIPTAAFARTPGLGTNATPATQAVTLMTDDRGRYAERFPEGAHTIRASASGYTTVWRQIIVPAGAGVIPIDIRLTPVGETKTATTGALTLAHGGGNAVTRRAELTIPAGAVPAGTAVTLTSTGAQSLPGLLPLGWSPLAAAVVASDAVALPGSTLTFDVPQSAITAAAQTLTAVRYDESRDEWHALAPVVNVANDKASFDIATPGAYALVYGDRRPGLASPPPPSTGAPLQGVVDACVGGACPPMVARSFPLDPPAVLPTGSTVATLEIEGQDPHVYPSGTAVQAYIDEELRLADGGRELDPPFATDLLLYRDLDGNTGVAAFHLAPSPRAAEVFLEVGFDHIRVVPYPGRLDRGTLVGPEGGRVPADDKVAVEIPTGATPVELRATASSIADPDSFGPIAGYTIIGGVQLSLQHIQQIEGEPLAPVELTRPARATFTLSTQHAALSTPPILVELLDQTPYGNRMFRLAAEMTQLDASRWTTKSIDRAVLPVDGIIREGRYLLLAPQSPIAFAKGLVRIGATGAAAASARVITPGLGVADLTRLSGIFALPVPSAPAGPFTLVPRTVAHGDGATYQHATAPAAGAVVNVGDLLIVAQPPQVLSTIPANNATSVSLTTSVEVSFTPGIDPSSVGPSSLTVIDTTNDTTVAGTVTAVGALGVRWTLPAGEALVQGRRYTVAVAPSIRGTNATPLGQPYTFRFTTASVMTNDEVHPERISITIPDANGVSRIIGAPGALVANWLAVPVRRGRDFLTRYSVAVAADGSFTLDIGTDPRDRVTVADEIDLRVLNVTGALTAIVPLTPFVSEDGRAFVASTRAVTFTSADGIGVTVPAGAFDAATVVRVEPAQESVFSGVPRFSDELRMSAAVTVTFEGRARRPLELKLPALAGADLTRPHFLGILGQSSRGPRIMAVDPLYAADGALTTERPSSGSASTHRFATNAQSFQSNDPGDYTQGVIEAGQYAALDMRDVSGSQGMVWAFMDGVTAVVELIFDALHSMFVGERYIAESRGRIAFPIPSGVQFTVTGIDPATSLIAFEQTYSALPMGDPGIGTTIPNPATDFAGPHPVYGTPFRIEKVSAPPAGETLEVTTGLRLALSQTGNLIAEPLAPLSSETKISLLHVPSGKVHNTLPATISGVKQGDGLIAMIEDKDVAPTTLLSVVLNEGLDLGEVDPGDGIAVSTYLKTLVKLEAASPSGGSPVDLLAGARLQLDSGNRRMTLLLPSPLPAGKDVRLTLSGDIQDRSGNGLGLGQVGQPDGSGEIKPIGPRQDLVLHVSTRNPAGTIAQFDIRQSGTSELGQIRELARYDNLMFVAAMDGGVLAYDLSDPAALDDSSETKPTPIAQAPANLTDYWAVQVDHHGRVFTTGMTSLFGVLRTFRAEDFVNATAGSNDSCMPSVQNAVCRIVGSAVVSQAPGSSTTLGIASAVVVEDRVEAIARKVRLVVGDDAPQAYSRQLMIDAFANGSSTPLDPVLGSAGLVVFHPKVPASSNSYRLQRITIENVTLGLRWSADAKGVSGSTALAPAEFKNVIAAPNDILYVTHNRTTHAVVSLFGHGIGIYDVNAIESNDHPEQIAGAPKPKEEVATKSGLSDLGLPPESIADIRFSPESEILGISDGALRVYSLDNRKGVVEMNVDLPSTINRAGEMLFITGNARFDALKQEVLAINPSAVARFNSSALYRNPTTHRTYLLLPALQYGLLVAEVGSTPLTVDSFADAVWLPAGAYAVRVIERSNLAVVVDGGGYAHLLDLLRLDEREAVSGPGELFPTAAASIPSNAPDPRILWTSEEPIAQGSGFIPPLVDAETGMMYSADLNGRRVRVASVIDPRLRVVADIGDPTGLREIGTIASLGIDPPEDAPLNGPNASMAAFRFEVALPGSLTESLPGGSFLVELESERVTGVKTEDTPAEWPRAHLKVPMQRLIPAAMTELRYQRGYNRWVSPWVVGVADIRASEKWQWPAGTTPQQKAEQGCLTCERPVALKGKPEPDVFEWSPAGRLMAARAVGSVFQGTAYEYLTGRRLETRIAAVPADTLRPREAQIAAQNPPIAEGALQETTYVHSGEIESFSVDLNAGGRMELSVIADRTYLSRTLGGTAFGAGWDSMLFRRLRPLPNGSVEYRDGRGEVWLFKSTEEGYESPLGLFLKLNPTDSGWILVDQQWRQMRFDALGRLTAETDQLFDGKGGGNITQYLYDARGRLAQVVDPLSRITSIAYNAEGYVSEIRDWRGRRVNYFYEAGRLVRVELPEAKAADGVPAEFDSSGAKRPRIIYAYDTGAAGSTLNDTVELKTNLLTIHDPVEAASGGPARVTFEYTGDRVTKQQWATGESATFAYAGGATTVFDALGQERAYQVTGANLHDKRKHISVMTVPQIPVLQFVASAPSSASPTLEPAPKTLTTSFTYTDHGQVARVTFPNLLTIDSTYEDAYNGAPGTVLVKTREGGPSIDPRETSYMRESSANLITAIGRSEGASGATVRDTPRPTRAKKITTVTDENVSVVTMHNAVGQVTRVVQKETGEETPAMVSEIGYYATSDTAISRGRTLLMIRGNESDGPSGAEKMWFTYHLTSDGGERVEVADMMRKTASEATFDSHGRKVREIARDANGTVLADERFGYDASGRLAYHARRQAGVGTVETRAKYDSLGRAIETTTTHAAVNGSGSTVRSTSGYDLAARRVTQTDPTAGSTSPAETVTTVDGIGRVQSVERRGAASTQAVVQRYGYDAMGRLTYESDGARVARIYRRDFFGRPVAVIGSDGTTVSTVYTPWGEVAEITSQDATGTLVSQQVNFFTDRGRLRSTNEATATGARKTHVALLSGGKTTVVRIGEVPSLQSVDLAPGPHRATQTVRDAAGHVVDERLRELGATFDPDSTEGTWARTRRTFTGGLPTEILTTVAGTDYVTKIAYDGLGRPVLQTEAGVYTTTTGYDEANNVLTTTSPGMQPETASYDSRGLVTRLTLPDGKTNEYRYDALGNVTRIIDEAGQSTFYDYDPLGRVAKIRYADTTTEETGYEDLTGALRATRNRAGQWLSYSYDSAGRTVGVHDGEDPAAAPLLVKYEYDAAGRLRIVRNKDAGVVYDDYDPLGRPGITRTYRYRAGTGLEATPELLDQHTQRHTWSIYDGERASWRMPAVGTSVPPDLPNAMWLDTIVETRDPGSNLVKQTKNGGAVLTTADAQSAGRIDVRRRHLLSGSTIATSYGFADGNSVPGSIELPPLASSATPPASGLPLWSETSVGNTRVAGSANVRDAARRLTSLRELGTQRLSGWGYDERARLTDTWLDLTSTAGVPAMSDLLIDADFRSVRSATPLLSASQHALLGDEATKIESLNWTSTRTSTHGIDSRTLSLDGVDLATRDYTFSGGRRTSDGVWAYTFDQFGRVTSATSGERRIELTWGPSDRLVGRVAYRSAGPDSWLREDRADILDRDGLPAATTFVWDPVVDRLVAIYGEGASTDADAPLNAGLLRQYLHGDQAYDDPTRVLVATTSGTDPQTYFPVADEAGTGSLAAVVDAEGNLVERVLYADAYGDAPRYLQGAVADKISLHVSKDEGGNLTEMTVRVHLSEPVIGSTLETGARLASVKADKSLAQLATADPDLEDPYTIRWSLSPAEWSALANAPEAASLEVSLTSALRTEGWGTTPPMPFPQWVRVVYEGADATPTQPVIFREAFSSVAAFTATIEDGESGARTLYEIHSLYLAASEESKTKLLTGFKAAPFVEPATGLVYMRDRWYDASTGTFLTPDAYGTIDSSNLYAYCANDPVNCSDPMGTFGVNGIGPIEQYVIGRLGEKYVTDPQFASDADAALDVTMQVVTSPAFQGTLQVVGGCSEAALGAYAVGQSAGLAAVPGWIAFAHGSDVCGAGFRTLWTGEVQESLTKQGAEAGLIALGASPETADVASTYIDAGLSAYGAIGSSRALLGVGRTSASLRSGSEYVRVRAQGYSPRGSSRLARPYTGRGHHFIFESYLNDKIAEFGPTSVRGRFLNWYKDSSLNVVKARGMTTAEFYELHARLHGGPAFGTRTAQGMRLIPGEPWRAANVVPALQPYGKLGYLWHASPTPLKLTVGGALGAAGGAVYYSWGDRQ